MATMPVGEERFSIPGRPFRRQITRRYYTIRRLVPLVIAHYLETFQDEHVREHVRQCCIAERIDYYLATRIIELNRRINDPGARIWNHNAIIIPTAFTFFSSVFPLVRTYEGGTGTIRTSPEWGRLNNLQNAIELENIAANPDRVVEFNNLSPDSQRLIVEKLHEFKIHSANDANVPQAIRVFKIEYLGRGRNEEGGEEEVDGAIDHEVLNGINDAVTETWRRTVYYERVTVSDGGNDTRRYFWRLGVRPIIPRFNQQGTPWLTHEGGDWGNTRIPRTDSVRERERTMHDAGCAVALVANMTYTQRERLIALGRIPEEERNILINPGTIAQNRNCASDVPSRTPVYFNTAGGIIWHEPVRTMIRNFPELRGDTSFSEHSRPPRRFIWHVNADDTRGAQFVNGTAFPGYVDTLEPERMLEDDFMNNQNNNQFYVAIRIFVFGAPETVAAGQHWVGVNELVERRNPATGDDTLYYRISPTSINDRNNGANRGGRGWLYWPTDVEPQDIYIPLSEVVEYRIWQIPQNQ